MRYAVNLAPFGEASDPRRLVELAQECEQAGWDGFFLWDHLNWQLAPGIADPWITLAACAMATQRVMLGTLVTPIFRRRPARLARETATLQALSGGRLVLGVGLGSPDPEESLLLGEEARLAVRGRMTDEALTLLQQLWTGQPVAFRGEFYKLKTQGFWPVPPPIPVWVAATWPFRPAPLRRAARCQGVVPSIYTDRDLTPQEIHELVTVINPPGPFEVVYGVATQGDSGLVEAYRQAGVTWWLEPLNPWVGDLEQQRRRLRSGPGGA